jgi:hypothetical protein
MPTFDLQKATAKAKFSLEKKGLPTVKAAVVLNLDVSGSAEPLFKSGAMQSFFETIVPLAVLFDDNKSLDVFTFADSDSYTTHIQPNANESNFSDYIKKHILNGSVNLWGGTHYAQIIRANLKMLGFLKEEKGGFFSSGKVDKFVSDNGSGFPALIVIATDGMNYDDEETHRILLNCQNNKVNAYFLFVGIGDANFKNIVKYGDRYSNVGFLNVRDLNRFAGSDDVYDQLLPQELVTWFANNKK